jgi:hypothetical protein
MVISYSGRLVGEKAGRQRAFTDDNIRALVKAGAEVVIYGHVQAQAESEKMRQALVALQAELSQSGGPGRLIFKSSFTLAEQIALLAASDLQVQDSDRGTEAAGFTEADAAANGALELAPPWLEGILQAQGVVVDRDQPGAGNTLLPADGTPAAYLEAMKWALATYERKPDAFAAYQLTSIRRVPRSHEMGARHLRAQAGCVRRLPAHVDSAQSRARCAAARRRIFAPAQSLAG